MSIAADEKNNKVVGCDIDFNGFKYGGEASVMLVVGILLVTHMKCVLQIV